MREKTATSAVAWPTEAGVMEVLATFSLQRISPAHFSTERVRLLKLVFSYPSPTADGSTRIF